jgi:hypothetical protein
MVELRGFEPLTSSMAIAEARLSFLRLAQALADPTKLQPKIPPGKWLVELRGFEPLTSSMPWKRSSQLSYSPDGDGAPGRI